MPKNSHEDQIICSGTTGSTLTSKEESENYHLTLSDEKDELIQNSKNTQSATNLSTSEGKAMEITEKKSLFSSQLIACTLYRKSKSTV